MSVPDPINRQREKVEALGHLAGGVAHELNNMLQPIFFAVDTIQRRSKDDDIVQKSAEKILSCTTKAAEIIDDILTFSRQDGGRLDFIKFDDAFEQALTFAKDVLPKTVTVNVIGAAKSDYGTWINQADLVRVLGNVLSNASDAMDNKGWIHINVEYVSVLSPDIATMTIPDFDVVAGRYVRISIKDIGQSFSKASAEDIFTPFFTTKDNGMRTGLGLSIVYRIVKNWKGFVDVQEHVHDNGQGANFLIHIPVYRTE
jgi:signal transduction histidine kinase